MFRRRDGRDASDSQPVQDTLPPSTIADLEKLERIATKQQLSAKLSGPIGVNAYYCAANVQYTYSEVVVVDWLSRATQWKRGKLIVRSQHFLPVPPEAVKDIQMTAWLCSVADYLTEDGGWAIDLWVPRAVADPASGDPHSSIEVTIAVAVRGVSAKLNRIGYTWTAYVQEAELPR